MTHIWSTIAEAAVIVLLVVATLLFLLMAGAYAAERGLASHYGVGDGFHGRRAACGSLFNAYAMTAAHRTLPCGTKVQVINLKNNRSVIVTITDRGPAKWTGKVIDLSYGAASKLGFVRAGTAKVMIKVLK